jgi:hypothetical protein
VTFSAGKASGPNCLHYRAARGLSFGFGITKEKRLGAQTPFMWSFSMGGNRAIDLNNFFAQEILRE